MMKAMIPAVMLASLASLVGTTAAAEPAAQPTTIEALGTASSDVPPDFAEFRFVRRVSADSVAGSVSQALPFEETLHSEIDKRNILTRSVVATGPSVVGLEAPETEVTALVQVPLAGFRNSKTGPADFAAACDAMRQLAKDLKCSLNGPDLRVLDTKAIESAVLGMAVENAYSGGEAVSRSMQATITTVENVRVLEVAWKDRAAEPGAKPDLKRITCTATVAVKYTAAPSRP